MEGDYKKRFCDSLHAEIEQTLRDRAQGIFAAQCVGGISVLLVALLTFIANIHDSSDSHWQSFLIIGLITLTGAFLFWAILPLSSKSRGRSIWPPIGTRARWTRVATFYLLVLDIVLLCCLIGTNGGFGKSPYEAFLFVIPAVLSMTRSSARLTHIFLALVIPVYLWATLIQLQFTGDDGALAQLTQSVAPMIGLLALATLVVQLILDRKRSLTWGVPDELHESVAMERQLGNRIAERDIWPPELTGPVQDAARLYIAVLTGLGYSRYHISKVHTFDTAVAQGLLVAGVPLWSMKIGAEQITDPTAIQIRARAQAFGVIALHWIDDLFDWGLLDMPPSGEGIEETSVEEMFRKLMLRNRGFDADTLYAIICEITFVGRGKRWWRNVLAPVHGPIDLWGPDPEIEGTLWRRMWFRTGRIYRGIIRFLGGQRLVVRKAGSRLICLQRGMCRIQIAGLVSNVQPAHADRLLEWVRRAIRRELEAFSSDSGCREKLFQHLENPWWVWASSKAAMEYLDSYEVDPFLWLCDLSSLALAPILYYQNASLEREYEEGIGHDHYGVIDPPNPNEMVEVLLIISQLLDGIKGIVYGTVNDRRKADLTRSCDTHALRIELALACYDRHVPEAAKVKVAEYVSHLRRQPPQRGTPRGGRGQSSGVS